MEDFMATCTTEASLLAALNTAAVDAAFVDRRGAPMEKPMPLLTRAVREMWLDGAEKILTILEERKHGVVDGDGGLCAFVCQNALVESRWMKPVALTPDFQRQSELVRRMVMHVKECDHASKMLSDAVELFGAGGLVGMHWKHCMNCVN
jgi:hypothetical protein